MDKVRMETATTCSPLVVDLGCIDVGASEFSNLIGWEVLMN